MLSHLVDVSVRSLILAFTALIFLAIAGRRRTAALQHAVCTTVVCGMLALFVFGDLLPRFPLRIINAPAVAHMTPQAVPADRPSLDIGFPASAARPVPPQPRAIYWQELVLYAYLAVALAFLARFAAGLFLARRLFSTSRATPLGDDNVYESPAIAIPVALGSKILLPPDWPEWDNAKLFAVLAHEGAHVRRHDSLIAGLAGLNRCLFWFHPLAWFLERRLALLADQACDDACIAELGDPAAYARLLLEMASTVGAHGRLRSHLLTMAAPSHIRQRIDALLTDRRTFSRGLTRTAWALVLLCAIPLVLFGGIAKLDRRPAPLLIDLPRPAAPAPPLLDSPRSPIQIAQSQIFALPAAAPPPATTARFDDVSVKPCEAGDGAGRGGRGGAQGRGIPPSPPGEIYIHCLSVFEILNITVNSGAVKLLNDPGWVNDPQRVQGGPPWIYTDLWTIDAKTTDPDASQWSFMGDSPPAKMLKGPMLTAMIEDQFGMQTHHKTEEVPMYALTLAPGGSKLQPADEGSCIVHVRGTPFVRPPSGSKPLCTWDQIFDGPNWKVDAYAVSISQIARVLGSNAADRPVIDKTGVTGIYTFHLKFAPDPASVTRLPRNPFTAPTADNPIAPPLNTVLEQELGLTLVPDKGPRESIVIDRARRPSSN